MARGNVTVLVNTINAHNKQCTNTLNVLNTKWEIPRSYKTVSNKLASSVDDYFFQLIIRPHLQKG